MGNVKQKNLTEVIDELAVRLLERLTPSEKTTEGEKTEISFEQQLALFRELTKWAAAKNKISPDDDEGGKLNEYRNKLSGDAGGNRDTGRDGSDADGEADDSGDGKLADKSNAPGIGDGIKALIAKKPSNDSGNSAENERGVRDDGESAGSEDAASSGDDGGVRAGSAGDNAA